MFKTRRKPHVRSLKSTWPPLTLHRVEFHHFIDKAANRRIPNIRYVKEHIFGLAFSLDEAKTLILAKCLDPSLHVQPHAIVKS